MASDISSRYFQVALRGGALKILPFVIKAMLNEALTAQKVDTQKAIDWVKKDEHLISHIGIVDNAQIKSVIARLGITKIDDSWITTEWMLEAIRKQHPKLYSLMMGWPAGYAWCGRQVIDIKLKLNELLTVQIT